MQAFPARSYLVRNLTIVVLASGSLLVLADPADAASPVTNVSDAAMESVGAIAGAASKGAPPHAAPAAAAPMTKQRALRLLRIPEGSTSLGKTSHGRLYRGTKIPLEGPGYAFFPHIAERGTHFGTDEMKGLIPRLGQTVQKRVRKSPRLRLGNVSLRSGGRSQWHVSHQAGRDVDLCMYALDQATSKPVELENFVKFRWRGRSRDGLYIFDSRRNMELIRALVTDPEVSVQWVFVARWLKRRIMAAAVAASIPEEIRGRMSEVMRQPSDSAPHDDHFHVRIYCSSQDRKFGCVMRDPIRDWAQLGEDEFQAHVKELTQVLDLPDVQLQRRALFRLSEVRAESAVGPIAERLNDPVKGVRQAAYLALVNIASPLAGAPILSRLPHIRDPVWARSVMSLLRTLEAPQLVQVANLLVRSPSTVLHKDVRAKGTESFKVMAAEILRTQGRKHAVPALLALLSNGSKRVRTAAHTSLLYVTGQRIHERRGKAPWQSFYTQKKGQTWLAWMRSGLRSWGVQVNRERFGRGDVPKLIRALKHGNRIVRYNAERVLTALTGHEISDGYRAKLRSRYRVAKHWKHWWKRHERRYPQLRAG